MVSVVGGRGVVVILRSLKSAIVSCTSAKAERSLSSLYGMFLCVELGDPPPPGQDFMGLYQNTTPLLYDCRFDMTKKTPPG